MYNRSIELYGKIFVFVLILIIVPTVKKIINKRKEFEDGVPYDSYDNYVDEEFEEGRRKFNIFGVLMLPVLAYYLILKLNMFPGISINLPHELLFLRENYRITSSYYFVVSVLFFITEYSRTKKTQYIFLLFMQMYFLYGMWQYVPSKAYIIIPLTGFMYMTISNSKLLKFLFLIYALSGFMYLEIFFHNIYYLEYYRSILGGVMAFRNMAEFIFFLLKGMGIDRKKISY